MQVAKEAAQFDQAASLNFVRSSFFDDSFFLEKNKMKSIGVIAFVCVCLLVNGSQGKSVKKNPFVDLKRYSVSGVITLPYVSFW